MFYRTDVRLSNLSRYDRDMALVGDRDREHAAHTLRRHYADGRLDEDDLAARLELVLRARSRWELAYALRRLPRLDRAVEQARHGLVVVTMGAIWLLVTVAILVAFVAWIAAQGASLTAFAVFGAVWLAFTGLLHRRTTQSRRRLERR
jgi:hypothetical protein